MKHSLKETAQQHLRAIILAITGFTCWAIGDTFNKLLSNTPVPKYQILVLGGLSGMATIFLITWLSGNIKQLRPKKMSRLIGFGASMPINFLLILLALQYLPLTSFYAICFMAPLCVAALAAFIFHEPIDTRRILAIIAGFIGVIIAIDPSHLLNGGDDRLGILAACASMLLFTGQSLAMRHLGKKETQECTAFYPRIFTVMAGLGGVAWFGWHAMEVSHMLYCILGGGIGGFGWLLIAKAYKNAPAATVAPFHYSQIATGALLGYFIWHDVPALHVVIGIAIIVTSGLYIVLHARRTSAMLKEPIA